MFGLSVPIGFALSRKTLEMPWFFIDLFMLPAHSDGIDLRRGALRGQSL